MPQSATDHIAHVNGWLQSHLLPCPFKYLTGIDCPGCGFQRSLIALFKGNLTESLHLYPATIPFLLTGLFLIVSARWPIDKKQLAKKAMLIITGTVILVSYTVKMYLLYT